jgi:sarcosine oxidase subunit alpha
MSLDFEGRQVPVHDGDTIASALYRAGVRTFSRSFKYHRRRGLYCLSGDCPNCLVQVDGESGVRSCLCRARDGQRIERQNAWPSADRDLLAVNDLGLMHKMLPVGFYYKTLIKPAWAWPKIEPMVRKAAGLGRVDMADAPRELERVHRTPDVLVIGLGPAGVSAALGAAAAGARVIGVDEGVPGERLPSGPTREALEALLAEAGQNAQIELLPNHTAIGIYEGPDVPCIGPDLLQYMQPKAIVVATGAFETHQVFAGNDHVGVYLGRGAARLSGAHRLAIGKRAVVLAGTHEAGEHMRQIRALGTEIAAVVVPDGAAPGALPDGVRVIEDAEIAFAYGARGGQGLKSVTVRHPGGAAESIACDALALSAGFTPQENILRQGTGFPVWAAGDVTAPAPVADVVAAAREVGGKAARGERVELGELGRKAPRCGDDGYVCLCEDVGVKDVAHAVAEGFRSSELLKRYTTVTMGPCQGRMCHGQLRVLAERFSPGAEPEVSGPTTARPPARPVKLEEVVAGSQHHLERRTALHDTHLARGASFLWAGQWRRVDSYGDIEREYRAVRERVGLIDVGTLGKFLVTGPDAVPFLERIYPNHVGDIQPGRLRYGLVLDEHGVIIDDGTICRLDEDRFYLTVTTSGAEEAEAWMLDWRDAWGHDVHLVNQTSALGAVNLAGPRAREVLAKLTEDDISKEGFPYLRQRRITVAGIPCLAIRLGFVGEVGWELHHPASRSVELWSALLEAGADEGIEPFGIQAQRLLRLEKGHIIVSQDTDFETTPWRIDMGWAVKLDKDDFVGKAALLRKQDAVTEKLVGFSVDAGHDAPWEGAAVKVGGALVGRVTSSWHSWGLGHGVGLCWVKPEYAQDGQRLTLGRTNSEATVTSGAAYDPEGAKLRG